MRKSLFTIFLLFLLSACSFDNQFLQPRKIPSDLRKLNIRSKNDTLQVEFKNENLQPHFFTQQGEKYSLGYKIESVVFPSKNGNMLNGWILSPIEDNQANGITIMHYHGNYGNLLFQLGTIYPLVNHGFKIFMFDYSGFGFSQGQATRDNVIIDGQSALDYLLSRKDIAEDKIVIYGQSLGGHLSAVIAEKNQDKIDGLVIEGAFSSHKDVGKEFFGWLGKILVAEKYSAKESIQNYHKPVLIIHSREDEIIPFKMGETLYEKANQPKEMLEIEHNHLAGPKYYELQISNKIKELLED